MSRKNDRIGEVDGAAGIGGGDADTVGDDDVAAAVDVAETARADPEDEAVVAGRDLGVGLLDAVDAEDLADQLECGTSVSGGARMLFGRAGRRQQLAKRANIPGHTLGQRIKLRQPFLGPAEIDREAGGGKRDARGPVAPRGRLELRSHRDDHCKVRCLPRAPETITTPRSSGTILIAMI